MERIPPLAVPDVGGMKTLDRDPDRSDDAVAPPAPDGVPDAQLVALLRAGDEGAFIRLVDQYDGALRRVARTYVGDAVADEVVQETWVAILRALDRFEARSSIRTWMVAIMRNIAITHARRERRQIPLSAFTEAVGRSEPAVPPDRFQGPEGRFPGGWVSFPERWDEQPERRLLASEGVEVARRAIASLPRTQQVVVALRDLDGWSSEEVADALGITVANQRVLLHRGRSKVRAMLEQAVDDACHPDRAVEGVSGVHPGHPLLERYYDSPTDRAALDAHVIGCPSCRGWLIEISERLGRLTCIEFVELVTDFLEDAVTAPARAGIDEHLRLCEGCRNYLDEMRTTVATIGAIGPGEPVTPSAETRAGLVAVFRLWQPEDAHRDL